MRCRTGSPYFSPPLSQSHSLCYANSTISLGPREHRAAWMGSRRDGRSGTNDGLEKVTAGDQLPVSKRAWQDSSCQQDKHCSTPVDPEAGGPPLVEAGTHHISSPARLPYNSRAPFRPSLVAVACPMLTNPLKTNAARICGSI